MARFIELTYYKYNSFVPENSGSTGKRFLLNVDDISSVTPYEESTKIRYKYTGEIIQVTESLEEVKEKLKGS